MNLDFSEIQVAGAILGSILNNQSVKWISDYLSELSHLRQTGVAGEHAYRPCLKELFGHFEQVTSVNDPKRSENGNPDFVFLDSRNTELVIGYAETKDIDADLEKVAKSEQMSRYTNYQNLILTNYLDFYFYRSGQFTKKISLGSISGKVLKINLDQAESLILELQAFFRVAPEQIKSAARLAVLMGTSAKRLRAEVGYLLLDSKSQDANISKIFSYFKSELIHDLSVEEFADMYAQTLVYGLFVARYSDESLDNFTRSEARDLIPASNPFLREFFDHIAGTAFERDLAYIVNELCQIFSISDVHKIISIEFALNSEDSKGQKDPIIHFYEDFLEAYDPQQKKFMGAYYTPIPIVRQLLNQVDQILVDEFNIPDGLADTQRLSEATSLPGYGKDKKEILHRVQILDPATGTATFLNELIKFVHRKFENQAGLWNQYVNEELIPRMHGFELMMAPYTVAHLKLEMTLNSLGAEVKKRIGVYLTNSLDDGVDAHPTLLDSLGLGAVITEESRRASEIKNRYPIMVVVGNPPYNGVSSNQTSRANGLIKRYKFEPGGLKPLEEKKHRLDDDYVKFIALSQELIEKSGEGVLAMITNHGFIDNASYRGMRWSLMQTFDEIRIVDLHGNKTKREVSPDGSVDENVFDIKQGTALLIAFKRKNSRGNKDLAKVRHADLWGTRFEKFKQLAGKVDLDQISPSAPLFLFNKRDFGESESYLNGISISQLFSLNTSGIQTSRDHFAVGFSKTELIERFEKFSNLRYSDEEMRKEFFSSSKPGKYPAGDTREWRLTEARSAIAKESVKDSVVSYAYRPFDNRFVGLGKNFSDWPRTKVMQHLVEENHALVVGREGKAVGEGDWTLAFVVQSTSDLNIFYRGGGVVMPLWEYTNGLRNSNLNATEVVSLLRNCDLTFDENLPASDCEDGVVGPLEIFDFIYGTLYLPTYRRKFKEFLATDFPVIGVPNSRKAFLEIMRYGRSVRLTHELDTTHIDAGAISFPVAGTNVVEKVVFDQENRIWINDAQYFGNVEESAWSINIGGYLPIQKWLSDRKGRELTLQEILHFQKVISASAKTIKLMSDAPDLP